MFPMFWWNWKLSLMFAVMASSALAGSWGWFAFGVVGGLVEHLAIHFEKELELR